MGTVRGTTAVVFLTLSLVLLLGRGSAIAQSAPSLSGTYTLKFHRYCQPFFSGATSNDPVDGDASYSGFNFAGSIKDQIGVATFNAKNKSLSG